VFGREPAITFYIFCVKFNQSILFKKERHLYTFCTYQEVVSIRQSAEAAVQTMINESDGIVKSVIQDFQSLFADPECRHNVWKGMLTPIQVSTISLRIASVSLSREVAQSITKKLKGCMRIGGDALMAIRKAAWLSGGPVPIQMRRQASPAHSKVGKTRLCRTDSIVSALGIMSPIAAVRWELDRRRRRREKTQQRHPMMDTEKEVGGTRQDTRSLEEEFRGDAQIWDVH
jgi:hypothetical protein